MMKNRLHAIAAAALMLCAVQVSWAQTRYIDEIFTDADIIVESDLTYGNNINFLTSDFSQTPQLATDIGTLSAVADAGGTPGAAYFDAADGSTQLKVTNLDLDIYYPSSAVDTETSRPVIVYLHTGNFLPPPVNGSMMGNKNDFLAQDFCNSWAKRGYVAVAVNYRLGWNPVAPDIQTRTGTLLNAVYRALQDTKQAVRFIKADAAGANSYGIDPTKIALFGEGSGGYISQAYVTLDNPGVELFLPKFTPNPFDPSVSYIDTLLVGPPSGIGYPNSLNTYRSNGQDAEVHMAINIGGALADESWLEAGDVPMVSFHAVRDDFAPFDAGTVIVPTTQEEVVDVHGSNFFIQKANDLGNNDVFAGIPDGDVYTDRARSLYGESFEASNGATLTVNASPEGLFPVVQPLRPFLTNISAPWQWWDPMAPLSMFELAPGFTTNMNQLGSNPNMSMAQSVAFQDSINGYLLPRLGCALDLPGSPCDVSTVANDAACDALMLNVDGVAISTTNLDATPDGPIGGCWSETAAGGTLEGDIWFTIVAPAVGGVEIETIDTGDNDDTQISVYSSSDGTCTGTLTEVGCNDDIDVAGGNYMSLAQVTGLTPGETYWIQVDGWNGTTGAFDIVVSDYELIVLDPCDFGDIDNINMALICDDIETYTEGGLDGQSAHWSSWSASPADQLLVSTVQAASGSNSIQVIGGQGMDGMLRLGNQATGVYGTIWKMFIPTGKSGYFNIQNEEIIAGGAWNGTVFFNDGDSPSPGAGSIILDETVPADIAATFSYPENEWFSVVMLFDLDNDVLELRIDGNLVIADFGYPNNLGGINFYPGSDDHEYYIDDVAFGTDLVLTVDERDEDVFAMFPNPTEGLVTLTSARTVESITVTNVLGAVVSRTNTIAQGNIEVDLSGLETGLYLITVEVEGQYFSQRVLKK